MKLDFHVHGKLSKKFDFTTDYLTEVAMFAKETGLDGFLLSEHFNTSGYYAMETEIRETFEYVNEYYLIKDMRVFTAMEIDVDKGGHVIVCGHRDHLFELRKKLDPYTEKGDFVKFSQLLDWSDKFESLVIGAHPFRGEHPLAKNQSREDLNRLDALDLNATDIYSQGLDNVINELQPFAEDLDIPIVTGSDSHYPLQVGTVYCDFNEYHNNAKSLRNAIKSKEYTAHISPLLDRKVEAARTTKAHLKAKLLV